MNRRVVIGYDEHGYEQWVEYDEDGKYVRDWLTPKPQPDEPIDWSSPTTWWEIAKYIGHGILIFICIILMFIAWIAFRSFLVYGP